MIQRIQSLWLFLAAMLNGALFITPLYRYNFPGLAYSPWQYESVRSFSPLMIIAAIITLLPLIALFLFKDRKKQKGMIWLSILGIASFVSVMLMHVANLKNSTPPATNLEYVLPGFLPAIAAIIALLLALRGINKDEKLVKSLDRLR